jgi:hypothetical protein
MPRIKVPVRNKSTGLFEDNPVSLQLQSFITAAISGGNNSNADVDLVTLNIPANTLQDGNTCDMHVRGRVTKTAQTSNILYYIKIGGVKQTLITYSAGTTAFTLAQWVIFGKIGFRVVGATTAWELLCEANTNTNFQLGSLVTGTVDTTVPVTITFGMNFATPRTGNLIEGRLGGLSF